MYCHGRLKTTLVKADVSKTLSKLERRYCVTHKELLVVVFAFQHFRHYLYWHKVVVRTDHRAIQWLLNFKYPQNQVAMWIELLDTYDMEIKHRSGARHGNAGSLCKYLCRQCGLLDDSKTERWGEMCNIRV